MPFDFTALLNDWGINITHLVVGTALTLILFVISLREFLYWFLRVHDVTKKQNETMEKLLAIESMLKGLVVETESKKFVLASVPEEKHQDPVNLENSPLAKKLH
jgi:hypothetical protein